MKSIDLKKRLSRNRPMTSVTIRIPEDVIEDLKEITMEQIRVIMDLVNRLKDVLFEKIFSPIINL